MMTKVLPYTLLLTALSTAFPAQAHDPKEHMQSADMPDCSSLQGMDHSKMDMTDPVTQALMQQCMSQLHSGDHAQGMGHNDTSDQMKHNSQTMEHHDDATDKMHDESAAMDHSTGHMH